MNEVTVKLGEKEVTVHRARLKRWFDLGLVVSEVRDAVESSDPNLIGLSISRYLSTASELDVDEILSFPWLDVVLSYKSVIQLNMPRVRFPMLDTVFSGGDERVPWEYAGREWYVWLHLLARGYSWSVEAIENLEIETGIALIQEILTEKQLDREWTWSLSEASVEYIESSKTTRFRPLPRPEWMKPKIEDFKIKKIKIPARFMPMGDVVDLGGMVGKV